MMKSSSGADRARSLADGDPIAIDRKDGVGNQEHLRDRVRVAALELDDCVLDKGPPRLPIMPNVLADWSATITVTGAQTPCRQHASQTNKHGEGSKSSLEPPVSPRYLGHHLLVLPLAGLLGDVQLLSLVGSSPLPPPRS